MPSPVIHSLAGLALERVDRHATAASTSPQRWVIAAALVAGASAPDLDFIPGILIGDPGRFHHGMSHSLFAAAVFGVASALLALTVSLGPPRRFGVLMSLAFVTHLLLDMVTTDHGIRHGVQLFWPVYQEGVYFPFAFFSDIKRDPDSTSFIGSLFIQHNAYALAWEFLILIATLLISRLGGWGLVSFWRRRRGGPGLPSDGAGATD